MFNGPAYIEKYDFSRLKTQQQKVKMVMEDGKWHTLNEVQDIIGGSESSISAQIRHLRKARFGGHVVDRRRRGNPEQGLFEYRLVTELQVSLF